MDPARLVKYYLDTLFSQNMSGAGSTLPGFSLIAVFSSSHLRGLPAPEAEMLYMQEVEKMEGYGQESYQAKVTST